MAKQIWFQRLAAFNKMKRQREEVLIKILFVALRRFLLKVWRAPMNYGPSNEIKEIEVCKKYPKVKPYCVPILDLSIESFKNYPHFVPNMDQSKTIWINFLRALVNWSLPFNSHSFHSLFELQLILWQFYCCSRLYSTRTQI